MRTDTLYILIDELVEETLVRRVERLSRIIRQAFNELNASFLNALKVDIKGTIEKILKEDVALGPRRHESPCLEVACVAPPTLFFRVEHAGHMDYG